MQCTILIIFSFLPQRRSYLFGQAHSPEPQDELGLLVLEHDTHLWFQVLDNAKNRCIFVDGLTQDKQCKFCPQHLTLKGSSKRVVKNFEYPLPDKTGHSSSTCPDLGLTFNSQHVGLSKVKRAQADGTKERSQCAERSKK